MTSNYCSHYCPGFGFDCPFRTADGYCTIPQEVHATDHTEPPHGEWSNQHE